jgi:ketosteroid isomerase-like protein
MTSDSPDVRTALDAADAGWNAALRARDVDGVVTFMRDDYALELVYPVRARTDLATWLTNLPDYVVHSWDVQASIWDVSPDVAVHLHLVDMRATVFGADRSGQFVVTDTWLRDTDGWRVWRRHSTPMSAGPMPGATS